MPKLNLTHQRILGLKAPDKPVAYYDTVATGLMLRLSKAGTKTFCYRYRFNGKKRRFTIGKFPGVSLKAARDRVRRLKVKVSDGVDPQAEKNKRRYKNDDPNTFKELATEFMDKHLPTLRESTRIEYERIINKELVPVLGEYPVNEITKNQVMSLLDNKAYTDKAPTMANRIRARLSRIFTFGMERGLSEKNPVQTTSKYKEGETKRNRYYNEKEIRLLWEFFNKWDEPTQSVLKMLLICGQRKTETMKMKWDDINNDVWTIPASLSKNKQPHDVPLSPMALTVLKRMKEITGESNFVFQSPQINNKPIDSLSRVRQAIQNKSKVSDFRPHDLRRTVATYMAKLKVDRTVLGKILNHKGLSGDGQVTAIYDRHSYMDEKRQALNRWSSYLEQVISNKEATVYKIA